MTFLKFIIAERKNLRIQEQKPISKPQNRSREIVILMCILELDRFLREQCALPYPLLPLHKKWPLHNINITALELQKEWGIG